MFPNGIKMAREVNIIWPTIINENSQSQLLTKEHQRQSITDEDPAN